MKMNILIVHEALPQPDRNGCDVRLMQIAQAFLAQGHQLTYVALTGLDRDRYTPPLERLGIKVYSEDIERFRRGPAWPCFPTTNTGCASAAWRN